MDEPEPEYSEHTKWSIIRNHQELMEAHKDLIKLLHRRFELDLETRQRHNIG